MAKKEVVSSQGYLGTHLIAHAYGIKKKTEHEIREIIKEAVKSCNAVLLKLTTYSNSNGCGCGVALIGESHISLYTASEHAAIDIFTCSSLNPYLALIKIRDYLKPVSLNLYEKKRGLLDKSNFKCPITPGKKHNLYQAKNKKYGLELIIDLHYCNPEVIRSKRKLQEYVDRLCKLINMKKYGRASFLILALKSSILLVTR
jgi:S-adenosylmethionine/arginine decarboxylase-like enzyme